MPLIVFLRGVNVGGHKTFRPSLLAQKLSDFDVQNIGAAGTFVVWKPGSRTKFQAELLKNLTIESQVAICDARDIIRLTTDHPFGDASPRPDVVRFVSILPKSTRQKPSMPIAFPSQGKWFVRLLGYKGQFVFGEYRRHMKTIGYLGQIDKLFGCKATTRNWNTIMMIVSVINSRRASMK